MNKEKKVVVLLRNMFAEHDLGKSATSRRIGRRGIGAISNRPREEI